MSAAPEAECGNCDWQGSTNDLRAIENIDLRVAPGEIMPAGECPKCRYLAHLNVPDFSEIVAEDDQPVDMAEVAAAQEALRDGLLQPTMGETMVCEVCGSEDVSADAAVEWDFIRQQWKIVAVLDFGTCEVCGWDDRRIVNGPSRALAHYEQRSAPV